ncbi:50S ribosomal protein L2 [bacterium]|nr:50S ribosomal protein L2 [Candidatus Elulimicrobium humile]
MIKHRKPTTPGRRRSSVVDYRTVLTKAEPEKSLLSPINSMSGRNSRGVITVRHKGGRNKRMYRLVDFKQNRFDIDAIVKSIEYDPNRSGFIALITYTDGIKSYILAPAKLSVGQRLTFSKQAPLVAGNRLTLEHIPVGTEIYNLELFPGKGGQIIRSAGSAGQVLAVEDNYALVKLPSGEVRKVHKTVYASIGRVSNESHMLENIGKAGRNRWRGVRPAVRGSAMNPVDHPHGGGEGRQPIGLKSPKTPWGKIALGKKTRRKNKSSNKFIISRRK